MMWGLHRITENLLGFLISSKYIVDIECIVFVNKVFAVRLMHYPIDKIFVQYKLTEILCCVYTVEAVTRLDIRTGGDSQR